MPSEGLTIPVPLQTRDDRRRAERFAATMPVRVDGVESTTHDLSTTGLSFVADRAYEPGARVEVIIEYLLDGHHYPLECEAEVVRSVQTGDHFTIGARLLPQSALVDVPVTSAEVLDPSARSHLRSVD